MSNIFRRAAGRLARVAVAAAAVLVVGGATLAAAPATTATEVERERSGSCTGTSRWELQLEREHGLIEVDLEVDSRRAGDTWIVRLKHDGVLFAKVSRVTDRDGEFEVDRVRNNHRGTDYFWFRAVNQRSGEVCTGRLSI
jgi:hypothetical protein